MRILCAAFFLFAASGSARAGWFGFGSKPDAQQQAKNAARMRAAVERQPAHEHVQGASKAGMHDTMHAAGDAKIDKLTASFEALGPPGQKGGSMNRMVSVYHDAIETAEQAIADMNKASTPKDRAICLQRAVAARNIAHGTLEIRRSYGAHGPKLEVGQQRKQLANIERVIGASEASHMDLMHANGHVQFGANNAYSPNSIRTPFQQSLAPSAPPPQVQLQQ